MADCQANCSSLLHCVGFNFDAADPFCQLYGSGLQSSALPKGNAAWTFRANPGSNALKHLYRPDLTLKCYLKKDAPEAKGCEKEQKRIEVESCNAKTGCVCSGNQRDLRTETRLWPCCKVEYKYVTRGLRHIWHTFGIHLAHIWHTFGISNQTHA